MDMAKVDCSGLSEMSSVGIRAGGTGMYEEIRERREERWTAYSGRGPFGVWMLTAKPLKQGIVAEKEGTAWANGARWCKSPFKDA